MEVSELTTEATVGASICGSLYAKTGTADGNLTRSQRKHDQSSHGRSKIFSERVRSGRICELTLFH